MSSEPRDVFVSYNRADRAWAEWIAWVLEEEGYSVAVQAWDSRPGNDFVLFMHQAAQARQTVAVLSPSFLEAEFTQPEWAAAFVRDPGGAERTLIPVRVAECNPDGLLRAIVYADLVGLDEEGARQALLGAFAERGKPPVAPAFPGGGTRSIGAPKPKPAFPGPSVAVSTSKLPVTGPTFVAREAELARLDAAWAEGLNVLTFVAMGGAGKSALVNEWLGRMQEDGWRGAERVLGWSFYSQGTDSVGASSEAFSEYALGWLDYQGDPITSPWRRGEVLARLVRERKTLLVLDGLEPLQHPPGAQKGRIKDPTVQALVRELAADNPGLCVVTTRLEVADLAGRAGTESLDLEKLPPEAGAELLRRLDVKGNEKELRAVAEELGGHGLALTLLGTYLRDICDGDIRRRGEAAILDETVAIEGSEHARNAMAAYERWFGSGQESGGEGCPELRVLRLLGLFDRPAEPTALAALRAEPEVPGLTEEIAAGDEKAWKAALARLRQARLVAPAEAQDPAGAAALDSHPLVREYFGKRLLATDPKAWRAGNERLYDHYRRAAPEYPDTLPEMLPLYAALVHGCKAGKEQEACDEVYKRRILRGNEHFSWKKLGAFGAELTALAPFFERSWNSPSARLTEEVQTWLRNEVGYCLRALGRLPEAVQPMRAGLELRVSQESWKGAAKIADNLSELTLTLGDIPGAIEAAEKSVELADRSGDAFMRVVNRAILADALDHAGRWEESEALFREAEAMQAEWQSAYPRLYSLRGYQYCDLLLGRGEPEDGSGLDRAGEGYREACEEVRERAAMTLGWAEQAGLSLLTISLDHLSLGRAHLGLALTAPGKAPDFRLASEHLDRAVDGLREAGQEQELPRGLLARAALRRLSGGPDGAAADLLEAQEIAERGSMHLFEADAHLEWTRLHLDLDDPAAARPHLDRARDLVRACGYGRREREVTWLEGRLGNAS
jgi:tetratricopeptide (TPR) repeat protein